VVHHLAFVESLGLDAVDDREVDFLLGAGGDGSDDEAAAIEAWRRFIGLVPRAKCGGS
jgi:hypothetical protein